MKHAPPNLTTRLKQFKDEEIIVSADPEALADLQLEKWRLINRHLVTFPFTVSESLGRGEQWRRVRDHLKKTLNEKELVDWVVQQIDVAGNLAAGIHEMRPRKQGPCYDILMEWVVNRRIKAEAVMRWVRGESSPDFPTVEGVTPP
ncbi:MAG: hypothetical protein ACTSV1_01930 [Alphaproteobacteria bacterium]